MLKFRTAILRLTWPLWAAGKASGRLHGTGDSAPPSSRAEVERGSVDVPLPIVRGQELEPDVQHGVSFLAGDSPDTERRKSHRRSEGKDHKHRHVKKRRKDH